MKRAAQPIALVLILFMLSNGLATAVEPDRPPLPPAAYRLRAEAFPYRAIATHDALWKITRPMAYDARVSQNALMIAILRRNPEAFRGGNIYSMHVGAVLTIPPLAEIELEDLTLADALVVTHEANWRSGRIEAPAIYSLRQSLSAERPPERLPERSLAPPPQSVESNIVGSNIVGSSMVGSKIATPSPGVGSETAAVDDRLDLSPGRSVWTSLPAAIVVGMMALWLLVFLVWSKTRRRRPDWEASGPTSANEARGVALDSSEGTAKIATRYGPTESGSRHLVSRVGAFAIDASPREELEDAGGAEASLKLLIAKTYLELEQRADARELLQEIERLGSSAARNEAARLLEPLTS